MKIFSFVLIIQSILSSITIVQPSSLKDKFKYNGNPGELDYSVSLFGEILYTKSTTIQVVVPEKKDNKNGCDSLLQPQNKLVNKIVWLVERGGCTYSKKAYIAQQSGAYAVLVYHNDPDASIDNVIPLGDSTCKLKR
jgi:hypothetical protein